MTPLTPLALLVHFGKELLRWSFPHPPPPFPQNICASLSSCPAIKSYPPNRANEATQAALQELDLPVLSGGREENRPPKRSRRVLEGCLARKLRVSVLSIRSERPLRFESTCQNRSQKENHVRSVWHFSDVWSERIERSS